MNCPNCSQEVPDTANVCGYCGHPLKALVSPPPAPTPTPISQPAAQPKSSSSDSTSSSKTISRWVLGGRSVVALMVLCVFVFGFFYRAKSTIAIPQSISTPSSPTELRSTTIPQATKPQPTKAPEASTLVVEPLLENNHPALGLHTFADGYDGLMNQTNISYLVEITSNTQVKLGHGWCASTQDILDQNLEHIQVIYSANGKNITEDLYLYQAVASSGLLCQYYRGIIKNWPVGEHTLTIKMIIDKDINDGLDTYSAGEYTDIFLVSVVP